MNYNLSFQERAKLSLEQLSKQAASYFERSQSTSGLAKEDKYFKEKNVGLNLICL